MPDDKSRQAFSYLKRKNLEGDGNRCEGFSPTSLENQLANKLKKRLMAALRRRA
jgi:hypothetical protein